MANINMHYILDENGEVKEVEDVLVWGKWFEEHRKERVLKQDYVDGHLVSTVFMGLDHSFSNDPEVPPILWETMVFENHESEIELPMPDGTTKKKMITKSLDDFEFSQVRYSSKEEALAGHQEAIDALKVYLKL